MKKLSIVLLALLLIGGMAFAAELSGDASVSFGYDLDAQTYGFTNATTQDLTLVLSEGLGETKGEGAIYAEITGSFDLTYDSTIGGGIATELVPTFSIDSATINGSNWSVDILGAAGAPDFAASEIDLYGADDDKESYEIPFDKAAGIAVTYDDFTVGLGLEGNLGATPTTNTTSLSVVTPAYEVADGVTVQAGGAFSTLNGDNKMGGSVEVVVADMSGLALTVAADMGYDAAFNADVAIVAAYDVYTLDAYFNTNATNIGVTNLLSIKAVAPVDLLTVTFTGKDLVNNQDLNLKGEVAVNDALSVSANGGYVVGTKAWNAGGDVTYTQADYVAKAGASYDDTKTLGLNASVESTAIISGATLSLGYEGTDVTGADKGAVTAKVNIAL